MQSATTSNLPLIGLWPKVYQTTALTTFPLLFRSDDTVAVYPPTKDAIFFFVLSPLAQP